MSNSGAKAALRGYRLQTLYILHEILSSKGSGLTFQPEGNEDLAVYQGDKLIRAVQIKALGEPLVLSNFIEANKEDTFIHRCLKLLNTDDTIRVEVISFGSIGNEIKNAWSKFDENKKSNQDKIKKKLDNFNISNAHADKIFKHLKWNTVLESQLNSTISDCLSKTLTSGSIENALSLLTAWLYIASEQQTKITHSVLLEKITSIGQYFSEREAHHQEWFKSIKPLQDDNTPGQLHLEKEYYRGISTRFSHIQANLDIRRDEQLTTIDEFFKTTQTVVIHGASGQGKTSLAYRYLHDFIPEDWRLQINFIENRSHAQNIALAIADHLAIFNATLYLYLDVSPRDLDWTALVKALLDRPNIKILISIREEDLARQNVSNEELGSPALVPLKFSKDEAEKIYLNLVAKGAAKPYPSFDQAWLGFGGNGSLLEYIFFLTQTESLKEKLKFQVKRLRCEVREGKLEPLAIKLLLACSVATSYEARIKIGALINAVELRDPKGTFNLFENEYLIRRSDDNLHIEALHPIRSKLLTEVLVDPAFSPWIDSALCVMPCLEENDLETFLLYAFIERPNEFHPLFDNLKQLNVETWGAVAGISRALLWFGISSHVLENREVINAARLMAGNDGWSFLLSPDIGNVLETNPIGDLLNILGKNNPKQLNKFLKLRENISSSELVYEYISYWLIHLPTNLMKPESNGDWSNMGEALLWMGRLKVNNELDLSWIMELDVDAAFDDIAPLADLSIGLYYFSKKLYQSFIEKNKQQIEAIFQKSTQTLMLEHQANNPIAHYIIPDYHLSSDNYDGSYLNGLSVTRATLLRKLFPENERYGAKGYGHQNILIDLPLDESHKNIIKSAIPLPQFVSINSTWTNYADYTFRPNNWLDYANNILSIRKQILTGLIKLNKTLNTYFKKKKSQSLIDVVKIESEYWEGLAKINWQLTKLPKLAVDPWGITSEGTLTNTNNKAKNTIHFLSMQNHSKNFRKSLNDYIDPLANFFNQSHSILIVNGFIGRLPKEQHPSFLQKVEASELAYTEHNLHLSCLNFNNALNNLETFQHEFRNIFKEIIPSSVLDKLEKQEITKLTKAWPLWYQFAHSPEHYWPNSPDICASAIAAKTKRELIKSITQTLNGIDNSSIHASILSDGYIYEGKKALWIEVRIDDISALEHVLIDTVEALTQAIRPLKFKDLKYFVMADLWEYFVIVPINAETTISNVSWVLLANSFAGDEPVINEDKPFLYLPRPISQQALNHFNLKSTELINDTILTSLEAEIGKIFSVINHIHCFNVLVSDMNTAGEETLQHYLTSLIEPLVEHIDLATGYIDEMRKHTDNDENNLTQVLDISEHAIQPYETPEDKKIMVNLSDCKEWAELLHEALSELQIIKLEENVYT